MQSDALPDRRKPMRGYRAAAFGTRRRSWLIVLTLVALPMLAVSKVLTRLTDEIAPPASTTSLAATQAYTPDQVQFVDGLRSSRDVLVSEGTALAELGDARSRNLVELSVRAGRYRSAAEQVDAYFQMHLAPIGLETLVADLRVQINRSLAAIDGSVSAIRNLDWDELAVQVAAFATAIDQITVMVGSPTAAEGPGS
jgi:hypothetical protein